MIHSIMLLSLIWLPIAASAIISPSLHEHYTKARSYEREHKPDLAITEYQNIIALDPNQFNAHVQLAALFFDQKKMDESIEHYEAAAKLKPSDAHVHYNLALAYVHKESWNQVITHCKEALALNPSHEHALLALGNAYDKLKQYDQAITSYKKVIATQPNSASALHRLGAIYAHIEQLENALDPYKKAVALQPTNLNLLMEYANVLSMLEHNEEAILWYKKMLEINPNIVSALYNIGYTLKKMGELDKALIIYDEIIAKKADYAPARFSRSGIYLMRGNFERGWDEYEWRFQAYEENPQKFNRPLWQGESLTNNSLVVYAEQGLGDTLQFIRFVKYLKQTVPGIRIVVESQDPLVPLLKLQPYIDSVVPRTERPSFCYYQIPLMSIPRIIKTRMETIPQDIPYIEADPQLVAFWHKKIAHDKNFKVGLCWQGNSHYSTAALRRAVASKSVPLEALKPLSEIPGVSLYCLQQITGTEQLNSCSFRNAIITFDDFDTTHGRFMDTAALIKNLDLVISVDTGICHLAGALGIPTWIMLPNPADWRWLLDRTDTPWYPNATLFKQPKPGDWNTMIHHITQRLGIIAHKNFVKNEKGIT